MYLTLLFPDMCVRYMKDADDRANIAAESVTVTTQTVANAIDYAVQVCSEPSTVHPIWKNISF